MQITISRGELKEACSGFQKIVGNKTTLPILGGVRLESNKGTITADVTDLDQHLKYRFSNVEVQGEGHVVVALQALKELAKGAADEILEFETQADSIVVTNHVGSQVVRHPLTGMDPQEWPSVPPPAATRPAAGFLQTYRRLVPFACTDTTRYILNSVFVDVASSGEHPVTMVSTDGRRLSLWNTMNLPLEKSVIVPTTKFLQWTGLEAGEECLGLRTERPKTVKGKEPELHVLGMTLSVGPWSYDVKTVDGTYPNFRQVIPGVDNDANRITFTDEDVQALRKILPGFPGSGSNNAGIALRPGTEGKLLIAGRNADDKTDTTLELTGGSTFVGKMAGIGVNAFFLLDALDAGFRVFTTTDEMSPLRAEDGRGGIHVLMPLRLDSTPANKPETEIKPPVEVPGAPTTTNAAQPAENVAGTPALVPPAAIDQKPTKGERKTMKEANGNATQGTQEQATALDKVLAAVDTAKNKLREAASALVEVADTVKLAHKDGKAQAADLEKARATLQKLQAISL
jgi:DNA polymerase-3 subunit beta